MTLYFIIRALNIVPLLVVDLRNQQQSTNHSEGHTIEQSPVAATGEIFVYSCTFCISILCIGIVMFTL